MQKLKTETLKTRTGPPPPEFKLSRTTIGFITQRLQLVTAAVERLRAGSLHSEMLIYDGHPAPSAELAPCPCCECPRLNIGWIHRQGLFAINLIECTECGLTTNQRTTFEEAALVWMRRPKNTKRKATRL